MDPGWHAGGLQDLRFIYSTRNSSSGEKLRVFVEGLAGAGKTAVIEKLQQLVQQQPVGGACTKWEFFPDLLNELQLTPNSTPYERLRSALQRYGDLLRTASSDIVIIEMSSCLDILGPDAPAYLTEAELASLQTLYDEIYSMGCLGGIVCLETPMDTCRARTLGRKGMAPAMPPQEGDPGHLSEGDYESWPENVIRISEHGREIPVEEKAAAIKRWIDGGRPRTILK